MAQPLAALPIPPHSPFLELGGTFISILHMGTNKAWRGQKGGRVLGSVLGTALGTGLHPGQLSDAQPCFLGPFPPPSCHLAWPRHSLLQNPTPVPTPAASSSPCSAPAVSSLCTAPPAWLARSAARGSPPPWTSGGLSSEAFPAEATASKQHPPPACLSCLIFFRTLSHRFLLTAVPIHCLASREWPPPSSCFPRA